MALSLETLNLILLLILLAGSFLFFSTGYRWARTAKNKGEPVHSLPSYYGWSTAIWSLGPAIALFIIYNVTRKTLLFALTNGLMPDRAHELDAKAQLNFANSAYTAFEKGITQLPKTDPLFAAHIEYASTLANTDSVIGITVLILMLVTIAISFFFARRKLRPEVRARNNVEGIAGIGLLMCSVLAIATTIGIVLSLLGQTLLFFEEVSPFEFLFGTQWSAQTKIRPDQVGQTGAFGAVPLFYGTFLISLIAMLVAAPLGLFSAIYMAEYASPRFRRICKPVLEILAGIPTVVYGFFAALTVAPAVRDFGNWLDGVLHMLPILSAIEGPIIATQPTSALAAGLVMGIMIIPFVSSLSDDVITAVPQSLRDGSYGLGATKSETIKRVIIPAALPGIIGALLLAVSRAIGETMIVVMAAGQRANITGNVFEDVTTITVQIVALLQGDLEFDSPKTLSAFALGFVLFIVTLILNIIALRVVQKYREKYE